MKEGLFIAVIAIVGSLYFAGVGSLYFAGTTISPLEKKVAYTPVKSGWYHQFFKYHTAKEIVNAAYDASRVYRNVNCSAEPSYSGYRAMTPLEKDMYHRIYILGNSQVERCNITGEDLLS